MAERYLGLISGTSVDGVDAVLAEFGEHACQILRARTFAYPRRIAERLRSLISTPESSLAEIGSLDVAVGRYFADCALAIIREAGLTPAEITAIGHHGQTVYHKPREPEPFSMQLGDASSVAAITGITTAAGFRALDIALGGQGAPLVPAFHDWLFRSASEPRALINIGGIANVTALIPGDVTLGFDTGPGNTLLDVWNERCRGTPYDDGGRWAATGHLHAGLLDRLLADPYFEREPPKSTGREHFNADWLEAALRHIDPRPADADVQATLVELTAETIAAAVDRPGSPKVSLIVCGGGAHNQHLLSRIGARAEREVVTTAALGLDPDWVEGAAFAWLARARLREEPGNVPSVTGARRAAVLGGLYYGHD